MKTLLKVSADSMDESMKNYEVALVEALETMTKQTIRSSFDHALIDSTALTCIKVANDLGFTDLALEMKADYEDMGASNG